MIPGKRASLHCAVLQYLSWTKASTRRHSSVDNGSSARLICDKARSSVSGFTVFLGSVWTWLACVMHESPVWPFQVTHRAAGQTGGHGFAITDGDLKERNIGHDHQRPV